jgi:hypothetical protein
MYPMIVAAKVKMESVIEGPGGSAAWTTSMIPHPKPCWLVSQQRRAKEKRPVMIFLFEGIPVILALFAVLLNRRIREQWGKRPEGADTRNVSRTQYFAKDEYNLCS